jgi:hypothetical protein
LNAGAEAPAYKLLEQPSHGDAHRDMRESTGDAGQSHEEADNEPVAGSVKSMQAKP